MHADSALQDGERLACPEHALNNHLYTSDYMIIIINIYTYNQVCKCWHKRRRLVFFRLHTGRRGSMCRTLLHLPLKEWQQETKNTGWWKKSGGHQLRLVVYLIIYRVLNIAGAGFLPLTNMKAQSRWWYSPWNQYNKPPFKIGQATKRKFHINSNHWIFRGDLLISGRCWFQGGYFFISEYCSHRIHVWYIYLHLVDFDGNCR